MKKRIVFLTSLITLAVLAGCGPSSNKYTLAERRQMIDDMAASSLEKLYAQKPSTRDEVASAAGYGVFSNSNIAVIFASGGGGYGVVFDSTTGTKSYMRMGMGGVGLGLGAKDYRQIYIFKTRQAMQEFVGTGWNMGGQADASAKVSKTGGDASGEGILRNQVSVYALTETGLLLQATVTGTKYWIDDELNQPGLVH
jgi:lipid-binding SYLF domain-containing protein